MNDQKNQSRGWKHEIRNEWSPKPKSQMLRDLVGAAILVTTFILAANFGLVIGGIFFAAALLFSLYSGHKWNF